MKREVFLVFVLTLSIIFGISNISALASSSPCQPNVTLLNQNPYPAVPGDYVKLVFQVSGAQNPNCGNIIFQLVPQFPFSLDPGVSPTVNIQGGSYVGGGYSSDVLVPYNVRVSPDALNGENPISAKYSTTSGTAFVSSQFNVSVNNTKADFEVFVKDFNPVTNDITFEILNIGRNNVQALTVEVPKQDNNVSVKGSRFNVVGLLDSYDYSTADFQISPVKGDINLTLYYNDASGTRRSVNKTVYFDPSQFEDLKTSSSSGSSTGYIILGVVVAAIVIYLFYRRHKKNKKKRLLRE